jgi:glycine betaine/proline transport system substrate-binding protein
MKYRILAAIAFAAMVMFAGTAPSQAGQVPESSDVIKLAINEWTGQHISTRVAGEILKRMGYNVEYVTAGYFPQFQALEDGTISASLEIWSNNIGDQYAKAEATGQVVRIGDLGVDTNEGWVYPKYMEQKCPGLPDWKALLKCADLLSTPETIPNGRIVVYPADWGGRSQTIIEALDLPYTAVPAGSEGALVAELKSAVTREDPLVMMFWAPHWVLAEIDVGWVKLPKYEAACHDDPSWGPNPNATGDCGVDVAITFKVAWKGMQDKWPAAYRFLEVYQIDDEDQIPMMAAIDVRGEDLVAVTKKWVDDNEAKWRPMVEAALAGS